MQQTKEIFNGIKFLFVIFCFSANTISAQTNSFGIGTNTPKTYLHVVEGGTGTMEFPYELMVAERNTDTKLGIYNSNATIGGSVNGGAAVTFGYTNYIDQNSKYPGGELQFGTWSVSQYFMRFNFLRRNQAGIVTSANANVMLMTDNGRVGVNLTNGASDPILPTANLHVNGTVRLQNLATGSGHVLVVDDNGNVYKTATATSSRPVLTNSETELQKRITQLEKEVKELKLLLTKKLDK